MESPVNRVSGFVDLADLSAEKLQQLETVLKSILALPIAQDTYAQIIDGNPTWQSYAEPNAKRFPLETTIVSDHPTPSPGAIQRYEEFRKDFTAAALKTDTQVCWRFNSTAHRSRAEFDIVGPKVSGCAHW